LHFHLQNSAAWFQGEGLPVRFRNATVNGVAQADAEPVRGDTVRAN
jgi:hypothetical protein